MFVKKILQTILVIPFLLGAVFFFANQVLGACQYCGGNNVWNTCYLQGGCSGYCDAGQGGDGKFYGSGSPRSSYLQVTEGIDAVACNTLAEARGCVCGGGAGLTTPTCSVRTDKSTYADGERINIMIDAGDGGEVYGGSSGGPQTAYPTISGSCTGLVGFCPATNLCSGSNCADVCSSANGGGSLRTTGSNPPGSGSCTISMTVSNPIANGGSSTTCSTTVTVNPGVSPPPPPPGPNLFISGFSVPDGTAGQPGTATVSVRNNGDANVSGTFRVAFDRLGSSLSCGGGNQFANVTGLNVSQTKTVNIGGWNYPNTGGAKTAVAMVDSACVISESDENDNVKTAVYDVCEGSPVGTPTVIVPADGITGYPYSPYTYLDWGLSGGWGQACPNDRHFYLTVSGPGINVVDLDRGTAGYYFLYGTQCGSLYNWHVEASNDGGATRSTGPTWSFTTAKCQHYACSAVNTGVCALVDCPGAGPCANANGCTGANNGVSCTHSACSGPIPSCTVVATVGTNQNGCSPGVNDNAQCVYYSCDSYACTRHNTIGTNSGGCSAGNEGSICGVSPFFQTFGGGVVARGQLNDQYLPDKVPPLIGPTQFVSMDGAEEMAGIVSYGTFAPMQGPPPRDRFSQRGTSPGWNLSGYSSQADLNSVSYAMLQSNVLKNLGIDNFPTGCNQVYSFGGTSVRLRCYSSAGGLNGALTSSLVGPETYQIIMPNPGVVSGSITGPKDVPGNKRVVVFVNGDLGVSHDVTSSVQTSGIVFILNDAGGTSPGNLSVSSSVSSLDGLYVFPGAFSDGAIIDNQLVVRGMLIGTGNAPFDFGSLGRASSAPPPIYVSGEDFIYEGKYLGLFSQILTRPKVSWKELPAQ